MNIKLVHLALCASVSFFAGLLLATGGFRGNASKTLGIAGLSALPVGYLAYLITDSKAASKLRKAEREASEYGIKLSSSERIISDSESKLADVSQQLELLKTVNSKLTKELGEISELLAHAQVERVRSVNLAESLKNQNNELAARIEDLQAETEEWQAQFHNRVETEADKRFQIARAKELENIFQEHDQVTQKAMTLYRQLREVMFKVVERNEGKSEIVKGMASNYNSVIDEFNQRVDKEREALLEQLEACNMRVGLLQHELNGDLIEPQYGEFGFDINGKIANAIAREIHTALSIPLAVKGFCVKSDGAVEVGYGYSRSHPPDAIADAIKSQSAAICKRLGIHRIVSVYKLEITDCIALTYRVEPAVKDSDIKLMVGTADEFIAYVTSNPIRYRLIADPGSGKTPTTAVMVSEIIKAGCKRGNVPKGKTVPHTLVTVAYPDAVSSLKDSEYPLEPFLKYGDTTAAIKSFSDAAQDWKYRKQNIAYAEEFFQLWVWDELDHTIDSASDPFEVATDFKLLLKKGGHNNIGYIASGQSIMTKQIPGFTNDDRSLFVEIIIGIPKIRHYLKTYGKGKQGEANLIKLARNLDELEEYIESKNELVTDDARLLRVALVVDARSPKLYFLPNLDRVQFNTNAIEQTRRLAEAAKRSIVPSAHDRVLTAENQNPYTASIDDVSSWPSNLAMVGDRHSATSPHCPHCGHSSLRILSDGRYCCMSCKKRFVESKVTWK